MRLRVVENRGWSGSPVAMCVCTAVFVAVSQPAMANVLCVDRQGASGCFSSITAAVAAAAPNDVIEVAPGTYQESIVITQPLSLIGANRNSTRIDATGKLNGIWINGLNTTGLAHVAVSGFTVENANFEGILVTNASDVTILHNLVRNNNKSLDVSSSTCPGLPAFETNENSDCGEGIHLVAVDHSIVARNTATNNSGGILLTDETGSTHDNVISNNLVTDNPYDCGITLASHRQSPTSGSPTPFGLHHNRVVGNTVSRNGVNYGGSGVGIFASAPGTRNFGNTVMGNTLIANGLPGVAMHGHAPNQDLNDNVIAKNRISGNGLDDDTGTTAPTGITIFSVSPVSGIIVTENEITDESIDVAVKTTADSEVDVHLNNLLGNNIGVENLGLGLADATLNWWKCSGGPSAPGCTTTSGPNIVFAPWLTTPF